MRKTPPSEEWIAAVMRDRRDELKPLLEGMGEENFRKVLAFCAHVRDLRPGRLPKGETDFPKLRRVLQVAEDIRLDGNTDIADKVTVHATAHAGMRHGESTIGYPFLFIGGGRGDSTDDLRTVHLVRVLEANFRRTFGGPRWAWIETLYGIVFDAGTREDAARKLFERSASRSVLEAHTDLGLKK